MSEATAVAPETRADEAANAAVEIAPVEDPVIETGEAYLEHLSQQGKPAEPAPETRPTLRPSVLSDPRAGQYIQDYRNGHTTRQQALDKIETQLIERGYPEDTARLFVKEAKDLLNAHHADGLRLSGYEAAATAVQYEQSHIQDAIAAALPKPLLAKLNTEMQKSIDATGVASYNDVMRTIVALSREGFVDDKDHKAALKEAFDAGRKQGLRGLATVDNSNTAKGRVQSVAFSSPSKTPKTRADAQAMHARGEIDNATFREYQAKLAS